MKKVKRFERREKVQARDKRGKRRGKKGLARSRGNGGGTGI